MSKDDTIVTQSYELIRKDLGLEEEWGFEDSNNTFDRLEEFLTHQIKYLLDHDFGRLLNALYRVDISEGTLKQILAHNDHVARDLARAVIAREKQKVLTRLKHRTSGS